MVQMMESWLIADTEALKMFYGQGFNANAIPRHANVEQIAKAQVESALEAATRTTQAGNYHKIRHGPQILGLVDVERVRRAATHCERLFATVMSRMNAP